jgi:DNA-binding NarL/FixJ family response regulator
MKTIVIADDHDLIRKGMKSLIAALPGYTVIAEARESRELLAVVRAHRPDVALVDITMPGMSGLDAVKELLREGSKTSVIMVSVHRSEPYIAKALSLGVKGYLIKDSAAEELPLALAKVTAGHVYLGECVATLLAGKFSTGNAAAARSMDLSQRERDVLRLVSEGKTAREMADLLCVSPRTVENNKNALLKKFGLHRTVDLVKYALEQGLID